MLKPLTLLARFKRRHRPRVIVLLQVIDPAGNEAVQIGGPQ